MSYPSDSEVTLVEVGGRAYDNSVNFFTDEVVIDFPSVATTVERMQSAFVEEMLDPVLQARICLSPRQALDGAVIPIDIPISLTCRDCGGRGESWAERCLLCLSTGTEVRQHAVKLSIHAGVCDGETFRFVLTTHHAPPTRVDLHVTIG
tara:strand:+ start:7857 stop:8303 length:447 start_codon:yes stop_codon:yes gene_type:complete